MFGWFGKFYNRLISKVKVPSDASQCWTWTGANSGDDNYGIIKVNGRLVKAHRASYLVFNGPIPDGHEVMHACDNPTCVNPKHLITGTHSDNMQDMVKKGRKPPTKTSGSQNGQAKLTEVIIDQLVSEYKNTEATPTELASRFGISKAQFYRILSGDAWGGRWKTERNKRSKHTA